MQNKRESPILVAVRRVAKEAGVTVYLEPKWQMAGCLTKGRRNVFFVGGAVDINSSGATALAKDKDFTAHFLARQGYSVVPNSRTFFSEAWGREIKVLDRGLEAAVKYAAAVGYPVVVKPNEGMQGKGVSVVWSKTELQKALHEIFRYDRVALVQSVVSGRDYRVVVLGEEVVVAYERRPLSVVGDGMATIDTLLQRELGRQESLGRKVTIAATDIRIRNKLKRTGYSLTTVPDKGEVVLLLDAANLSLGGTVVDVTERLHPDFVRLATGAARAVGLSWCGVDIMVVGSITDPCKEYWILEVNGAPGMGHYAAGGPKQRERTVAAYQAVFRRALGLK